MNLSVAVLAQVPAEAACLRVTLPRSARLGDVTVFSLGAGPEVAAVAGEHSTRVVDVPWADHYGQALSDVLAALSGTRLLVFADEEPSVSEQQPGPASQEWTGRPAAVGIVHRTSGTDHYQEEREIRLAPSGDVLSFTDRVYRKAVAGGRELDPDRAPLSPFTLVHHPARWEGLAVQRVRRTIRVVEAGLAEEPDRLDYRFRLFRAHCSLHDWANVVRTAEHWADLAPADDANRPVVSYYLACAAVAGRNPDAARRHVGDALDRAGTFADAWYLRGELLMQSGDAAGAEQAFRTAAGLGTRAHPVAVEDLSLATWRPRLALAALARKAGREAEARAWKAEAAGLRHRGAGPR
ncbi:tetratricopeptide repeat protein [Streptomyces huiliensis]|uniref:tetratricopeptide repeat protein n=1 Tax=Streptomyces huiliensis TaxID=2876027 RepID=UPI001CBDA117|nr:hypothetical protein [Streptomyces huiliensis]MBZ4319939.1 hypothetical protein [Streptomyces huiliensis]